jgi:DNA-binding MarR family transcriptional regulator
MNDYGFDTAGLERPNLERRKAKLEALWFAEAELIQQILSAAERISLARLTTGEPIYRTDCVWKMLRAVQSSRYCCAIADVARLLHVSRQRAHQVAYEAERRGKISLMKNPDDRRIVQIFLTPAARSDLAAARSTERRWLAELLLGLDEQRMAVTTHVLRVIRLRLLRAERERAKVRCP